MDFASSVYNDLYKLLFPAVENVSVTGSRYMLILDHLNHEIGSHAETILLRTQRQVCMLSCDAYISTKQCIPCMHVCLVVLI